MLNAFTGFSEDLLIERLSGTRIQTVSETIRRLSDDELEDRNEPGVGRLVAVLAVLAAAVVLAGLPVAAAVGLFSGFPPQTAVGLVAAVTACGLGLAVAWSVRTRRGALRARGVASDSDD
jgi:hypothetical protein